ncbi:MAG TPA: PQQ-dependent sugar dehydrogenase, partial [Candidatus Paceibacterota bacterium]|nr:PQQ-dependent sugar dehydrogenase [Candidatus Paceibacterota bacterium]
MFKKYLVGLAVCGIVFYIHHQTAYAAPTGFVNQQVLANLSMPTDFAWTPDGRILITQKNGQVVVVENGQLLSTPALNISVSAGGDRGLASLAIDPNFNSDHYLYLLYTTTSNHQRISRFILNGDTIDPNSETVLLENQSVWSGFLNAGSIRFGKDGKIYASFGSNGLGANAQDLSTLDGKLVRINPDGSIPSDNPFVAVPGAQHSIYAYGFRNPWKFSVDANGRMILGDVGEDFFEKIVQIVPGGNYGWPEVEGNCEPNCNGITPPLWVIPHNGAGAAVVGGAVYTGAPAPYTNSYFFGDYVQGTIGYISFDNTGNVSLVKNFESGDGSIAGINMGPEGCLYYITIFPGSLHKFCYGAQTGSWSTASADKNSGNLPLTVQFSSAGSSGTNYLWDFGDNTTSTAQSPSHVYTQKGIYQVSLSVDGSTPAELTIWAGYLPPNVTIVTPKSSDTYMGGQQISFSATATDPQDGAVPNSNYFWQVIFHHNTHIHPPDDFTGQSQGVFTVPTELHTATLDVSYEFQLTVKDSVGLSTTTSVTIHPKLVDLKIDTNPSGLQLLLDDQPITTPYDQQAVPGFERSLSAVSPQTVNGVNYSFGSWSNGGPQSQTFILPDSNSNYVANYSGGVTPALATSAQTGSNYTPGQAQTIALNVTSNTNMNDVLLDVEIWSPTAKVGQTFYPNINLVAGQTYHSNWQTTAPQSNGVYTIKLGVFSNNWSTLYNWNDSAGTFSIGSTLAPPSFSTSVSPSANSYVSGATIAITTNATADQDVPNALVDTELWSGGAKVAQQVKSVNFNGGIQYSSEWNPNMTAVGDYIVKLGIFSSNWGQLYTWNDNAGAFSITQNSNPGPTAFVVSASLPNNTYSPGAQGTVT